MYFYLKPISFLIPNIKLEKFSVTTLLKLFSKVSIL